MKSNQNKPKEKDTNNIRDIISIGSQIAGNVAGSAVGYFFADLPGAIAGGATGPIITVAFERLASEFKNRVLGKREEIRIGATMAFAIDKLRENMDNGKKIRDDEFFDYADNDRSTAEEVIEAVLLSAQREYEERKIKHYGILLANIATNKNINRPLANMLIRLAYQSSYHELCILSLAEKRYMVSSPLGYRFPRRYGGIDLRAASIVLGVRNLAQQQLLEIPSQQQDYFFMRPLGKTFSDLMGLDDVEKDDRDEIKQLLHEYEELAKAEDQVHAANSSFWPPPDAA